MEVITVPILPMKILQSYIIVGHKTIIVDTGVPDSQNKIISCLKKNNVQERDVSMILLTHSHIDHSGSVAALKKLFNVPVAIHKSEAAVIETGEMLPLSPKNKLSEIFKKSPPMQAKLEKCFVDIKLDGSENLEEFGIEAKLIHTPGHTDGSISIVLSNNEIIAGDVLSGGILLGGILKNNVGTWPTFHNDTKTCIESINKIIQLNPSKVYVGHGGTFTVNNLQKFVNKF